MRVTYTEPGGWIVESKSQSQPIRDFCKEARERQGITCSKMSAMLGVAHPAYPNFETGVTKTPALGFMALEVLGYSMYVLPTITEDEDNESSAIR